MQTLIQKSRTGRQRVSSISLRLNRGHFDRNQDVDPSIHLHSSNQTADRLLDVGEADIRGVSADIATHHFEHDFSRIPVYQTTPVRIQPKLTLNTPGDAHEKEADWIADQVMRMAPPTRSNIQGLQEGKQSEDIQAKSPAETTTPIVQRHEISADGTVPSEPGLEGKLNASKGGGSSLPDDVRSFMEGRCGTEFSQVGVHTDSEAVQQTLSAGLLQTKLKVSQPGDAHEQEADDIAEWIVHGNEAAKFGSLSPHTIDFKPIAREATPTAVPWTMNLTLHSDGRPLNPLVRDFFEPRFGRDFSGVRVHTGQAADESARTLNALAYTVGNDIVFSEGKYAPETYTGRKLLAHELTHVVQQESGSTASRIYRQVAQPPARSVPESYGERLEIALEAASPALVAGLATGLAIILGIGLAMLAFLSAFGVQRAAITAAFAATFPEWVPMIGGVSILTLLSSLGIAYTSSEIINACIGLHLVISSPNPSYEEIETAGRAWGDRTGMALSVFIPGLLVRLGAMAESGIPILRDYLLRTLTTSQRITPTPPMGSPTTPIATTGPGNTPRGSPNPPPARPTSPPPPGTPGPTRPSHEEILIRQVIEGWRRGGVYRPVKVVRMADGPEIVARGTVDGYITEERFIRGRTPAEMENILGLRPGRLQEGAAVVRLSEVPRPDQVHLVRSGGYTTVPGDPSYPPGQGAPQWVIEPAPVESVTNVTPGTRY